MQRNIIHNFFLRTCEKISNLCKGRRKYTQSLPISWSAYGKLPKVVSASGAGLSYGPF